MLIFQISLFLIGSIAFLYFGYKDDYRRNPAGFKTFLVGFFGSLLLFLCLNALGVKITTTIRPHLNAYYVQQFGWEKDVADTNPQNITEHIKKNNILEKEIENALSVFDSIWACLMIFVVVLFNRRVKRYFGGQDDS